MKKKMYYNMRIKTLKRNTSNVIRKGMEARQAKASQVNLNLNVLIRQQKDVEREVHERDAAGAPSTPKATEELAQLQRKLQVLSDGIDQKTAEVTPLHRTAIVTVAIRDNTHYGHTHYGYTHLPGGPA